MFIKWEDLPPELKIEEVKPYYDILKKKRATLIVKRAFDIVMAVIMIILLAWLFIVLAIVIKIDSEGPVFYRQLRVTAGNKDFKIYKFRTMVNNADRMGSLVTTGNDDRITRIGAKLRKSRIDEIPQLINILKGEMSFVGARPEVRKYVNKYTNTMLATLLMPAGVTSLASISFKHEDDILDKYMNLGLSLDDAYTEKVLPEKMNFNLEYIMRLSLFYDIKLMIYTLIKVLK